MVDQLLIVFVSALGFGIGSASAWSSFKHTAPPKGNVTDAKRQDALERFKTWNEFWKYFLVSFALVLITTILGNTWKERELRIQESKQVADRDLETAKANTASLIAENTNLGSFLDRALSEDWRKQYAFASYFSHLTGNLEAQKRWKEYATFIVTTRTETATLDEEYCNMNSAIAAARKKNPLDPQLPDLERKLSNLRARLEVNQAVLEPKNATLSQFKSIKRFVSDRGAPPDSFLSELIAWGKAAPDEIFAANSSTDSTGIYSNLKNRLGPWEGNLHRRAVMLEVMRVLAGFESGWNWNEGIDLSNPASRDPNNGEAGAWQVDANTMNYGPELKSLVLAKVGTIDPLSFQKTTKSDHAFAMEYVARLLRRNTKYFGALHNHRAESSLSRDAIDEFQSLIGNETKNMVSGDPKAASPTEAIVK